MRTAVMLLPLLASCLLQQRDDPEESSKMPEGDLGVFVTRGTYEGAIAVDDLRGLPAADRICELRAKAAGLGGTWVAWLSATNLDAIDRVESLGPWRVVGGEIAFEQRAQLYGEPLVPLDRDERGELLDEYDLYRAEVWTGTRAGGKKHTDTCNDWTTTSAIGHYGVASESFSWTDFSSSACGMKHRLVCIEL